MGTWSQPHTKEKAKELAEIMTHPIPKAQSCDTLYHLVGDDDLFDLFEELDEHEDVRQLVISHLKSTLKNLHLSLQSWDKKAISICQQLVNAN